MDELAVQAQASAAVAQEKKPLVVLEDAFAVVFVS